MYDKMIKFLTSKNGYDLENSTYTVETFKDVDCFYVTVHVRGTVCKDGFQILDPDIVIECDGQSAMLVGVYGGMRALLN